MTDTPFDLTGKTALVTGAARGLGRQIALDLARAGADVALGLRDPDADAGLVVELEALGGRVLPVPLDVLHLGQATAAIDRTVEEWGALDILVNNAGGGIDGPPSRCRSRPSRACGSSTCGPPSSWRRPLPAT